MSSPPVCRLSMGGFASFSLFCYIACSIKLSGRNYLFFGRMVDMRTTRKTSIALFSIMIGSIAFAAPPEGKGGGKGGGGGGGEDPPAETFVPAIAYKVETAKYEDIRLSNVEGDQSCLVMRIQKSNAAGRLRGFTYSASRKRLAYGLNNDLYLATWSDDPCNIQIGSSPLVPGLPTYGTRADISNVDFSPDGSKLVWALNSQTDDGTRDIVVLDIDGGTPPERIETGFNVFDPSFSPDFADSREIFFTGDNSVGIRVVGAYNLDTGATRTVVPSSGNLDSSMAVSNPDPSGFVRIAVRDNNSELLQQYNAQGNPSEAPISARDANLAYSCDNSLILYRFSVNWKNVDVYLGSRDGTSAQIWSSEDLRDPEWLC